MNNVTDDVIYRYLPNADTGSVKVNSDSYRILEHNGRRGFNATKISTKFSIDRHTLNGNTGSVSLWAMSLEDLYSMSHFETFAQSNPHYMHYNFLTDSETVGDMRNSTFSFCFTNSWYPVLYAKFYKGSFQPDGFYPVLKAVCGAGHFHMHKNTWYQLTLTFDKPASRIYIYVNGILAATSDTVHNNLIFEKVADTLYGGNPTLVLSDICFFDKELTADEVKQFYRSEEIYENKDITDELLRTYCGKDMPDFDFTPDSSWILKCSRTLKDKKDLDYFYVQGKTDAPSITDEGLYIETRQDLVTNKGAGHRDTDAVYLWTGDFFEGNLYLEYEFKPLQKDGLSLLMLQSSGMQREDFMKDYPLRTDGSMHMVCWEDVRNYHWEYFRNVVDVRNDVASHAMIKNPWLAPIGYSCMDKPLEINKWHKLQFLQIENHLRCVIDGKVVLDVYDRADMNKGPVLNAGRIGIRCMIRTKLLIRNMKVYNQDIFESKHE